MPTPDVKIAASYDTVIVTVDRRDGAPATALRFEIPGMLTGSDLRDVLEACGIEADYTYDEESA